METRLPFEQADARSLDDMRRVIWPGYDLLIHTPAWNGIHSGQHPTPDYWQINVDGTFNAMTAAQEAGTQGINFRARKPRTEEERLEAWTALSCGTPFGEIVVDTSAP